MSGCTSYKLYTIFIFELGQYNFAHKLFLEILSCQCIHFCLYSHRCIETCHLEILIENGQILREGLAYSIKDDLMCCYGIT